MEKPGRSVRRRRPTRAASLARKIPGEDGLPSDLEVNGTRYVGVK